MRISKIQHPIQFLQSRFRQLLGIYFIAFVAWLGLKYTKGETIPSLFLTQDQRGQLALNKQDYALAAELFTDPQQVGLAHYYNEDFKSAADRFREINDNEALFALANSLAHDSNYLLSQATYEKLLERDPNHAAAIKNHRFVKRIVDEMLAMGESQQQESGTSEEKMEAPPNMEFNTEQQEFGTRKPPEQLTADQLLSDPEMANLWMKQVQSDPAEFLSAKFQMQAKENTNQ
ncbi:hypothetical protein [Pelagicoccus mobilis]|uniref:Tetratricopeptide repeat protein n=1 Tax=Pelagicoccus mobilis TaxID=415221 RepID=A0A934RYQ3_9BACT|nr:hypothetical protein [Pelagicoccus mobilis]MBK1877306.1 hypothetical protein [Pelagicoccus mobilis]